MRKKRGTGIDSAWRGSNGDGASRARWPVKGYAMSLKKPGGWQEEITREMIPTTEPRGGGDRPPLIEKAFQCLVGTLLIIKIIYQTQ